MTNLSTKEWIVHQVKRRDFRRENRCELIVVPPPFQEERIETGYN